MDFLLLLEVESVPTVLLIYTTPCFSRIVLRTVYHTRTGNGRGDRSSRMYRPKRETLTDEKKSRLW